MVFKSHGSKFVSSEEVALGFLKFLVIEEGEQERDRGFDMFAFHIHNK